MLYFPPASGEPFARLPPASRLRARPRALQGASAKKSRRRFALKKREHAVAFDGLPRSPFPLATPVSPTGKGCSCCCNPSPEEEIMKNARTDLYSRITNCIVAELEKGVRPWLKPWNAQHAEARVTRPLRANGQPYNGINVLILLRHRNGWTPAVLRGA